MNAAQALPIIYALRELGDQWHRLCSWVTRLETANVPALDALHAATALRVVIDRRAAHCLEAVEELREHVAENLLVAVVDHAVDRIQRQATSLLDMVEHQHARRLRRP